MDREQAKEIQKSQYYAWRQFFRAFERLKAEIIKGFRLPLRKKSSPAE